jgi:hypothetical protein
MFVGGDALIISAVEVVPCNLKLKVRAHVSTLTMFTSFTNSVHNAQTCNNIFEFINPATSLILLTSLHFTILGKPSCHVTMMKSERIVWVSSKNVISDECINYRLLKRLSSFVTANELVS